MNVYAFITPLVLILLVAELAVCLRRRNGYYNFQDTVANLATGIGNQCVNLAVALVAAPYWWDKIRIWFMPLGWRPRGVGDGHIPRIGYTLEEQVKFQSQALPGSGQYLNAQIIGGLVFMFFTINQGFPFSWQERLLMSAAIFVMIVAWGGILQSKKWARGLESIRLLLMGALLLWVLHRHGMASWYGGAGIAISLWCGISLLWLRYKVPGFYPAERSEDGPGSWVPGFFTRPIPTIVGRGRAGFLGFSFLGS